MDTSNLYEVARADAVQLDVICEQPAPVPALDTGADGIEEIDGSYIKPGCDFRNY